MKSGRTARTAASRRGTSSSVARLCWEWQPSGLSFQYGGDSRATNADTPGSGSVGEVTRHWVCVDTQQDYDRLSRRLHEMFGDQLAEDMTRTVSVRSIPSGDSQQSQLCGRRKGGR